MTSQATRLGRLILDGYAFAYDFRTTGPPESGSSSFVHYIGCERTENRQGGGCSCEQRGLSRPQIALAGCVAIPSLPRQTRRNSARLLDYSEPHCGT